MRLRVISMRNGAALKNPNDMLELLKEPKLKCLRELHLRFNDIREDFRQQLEVLASYLLSVPDAFLKTIHIIIRKCFIVMGTPGGEYLLPSIVQFTEQAKHVRRNIHLIFEFDFASVTVKTTVMIAQENSLRDFIEQEVVKSTKMQNQHLI